MVMAKVPELGPFTKYEFYAIISLILLEKLIHEGLFVLRTHLTKCAK